MGEYAVQETRSHPLKSDGLATIALGSHLPSTVSMVSSIKAGWKPTIVILWSLPLFNCAFYQCLQIFYRDVTLSAFHTGLAPSRRSAPTQAPCLRFRCMQAGHVAWNRTGSRTFLDHVIVYNNYSVTRDFRVTQLEICLQRDKFVVPRPILLYAQLLPYMIERSKGLSQIIKHRRSMR